MTGEKIEYQRLYDLLGTTGVNMTTTGAYTFTSLSSGLTYSTATDGEYGGFLLLQTAISSYDLEAIDIQELRIRSFMGV
jgi:hypothetical protein